MNANKTPELLTLESTHFFSSCFVQHPEFSKASVCKMFLTQATAEEFCLNEIYISSAHISVFKPVFFSLVTLWFVEADLSSADQITPQRPFRAAVLNLV